MGTAHRPTSGKENRCRRTGAKDLPHPVRALARRLQISGVEGDCSGADGAHAATLWGSSRPAAPPPANHPPRPIQLRQSVGLQSISRKCTTLRRGVQRGLTADIRVISGAWCVQPHRQVVNPIAASSTDYQPCAGPPISPFHRPVTTSANSRLRPPRIRRLYLHAPIQEGTADPPTRQLNLVLDRPATS